MVWGLKAPVNGHVSAYPQHNAKMRGLATVGLGFLFVFCAPGQITKASYSSAVLASEEMLNDDLIPNVSPAAASVSIAPLKLAGEVETRLEIKPGRATILPQKRIEKTSAPVQMASLDIKIPEINTTKDFVGSQQSNVPALSHEKPMQKRAPKLEKKLFGSVELRFEDERKIKAWSSVYERFNGDVRAMKSCLTSQNLCADPMIANWVQELRPLQHMSKFQKITAVNTLVNRRIYADDRRNYGRSDYWASPSEFLQRGGDCEDYAILKFASLLALGVRDQDMRLVVGRLSNGTPHAFLATHIGSQEYILDNRQSQVYLTTNRNDYVPKYSMNLSYRWSHVMPRAKTI